MEMDERGDDYEKPLDSENAVEIKNSYFSWNVSVKISQSCCIV